MRTPVKDNREDGLKYLQPETDLMTPSDISPQSTRKASFKPRDGYQRLRNKQWVDRLYEKGKQKTLARSRSAYISLKEAEELKECSFHPKIKHNYEHQDGYHNNSQKLLNRLTQPPAREKARLEKLKKDADINKE